VYCGLVLSDNRALCCDYVPCWQRLPNYCHDRTDDVYCWLVLSVDWALG